MSLPPDPIKFDPAKQRLMDDLLDRNNEGTISAADKSRLTELVAEAESLMVKNSRRLAEYTHEHAPSVPTDAMPVTVWVKPLSSDQ